MIGPNAFLLLKDESLEIRHAEATMILTFDAGDLDGPRSKVAVSFKSDDGFRVSRHSNRPVPFHRNQVLDLVAAYLHGEMSEGRLRELLHERNGLSGDEVRALWFDAVERGRELCGEPPTPPAG